jgi:hypothetical protein
MKGTMAGGGVLLFAVMAVACTSASVCSEDGSLRLGNAVQALEPEGSCIGTAESCGSFSGLGCTQEGCSVDIGRYDDPSDDRCRGYPVSCSSRSSKSRCLSVKGCTWKVPNATSSGTGSSPGTSAGTRPGSAPGSDAPPPCGEAASSASGAPPSGPSGAPPSSAPSTGSSPMPASSASGGAPPASSSGTPTPTPTATPTSSGPSNPPPPADAGTRPEAGSPGGPPPPPPVPPPPAPPG